MARDIRVKICGLTAASDVSAAVEAGAAYVGFVFFEKSPRNVGLMQARALALGVPPGVAKVALTVDADDATLDALTDQVPLDFLQLHGEESPARASQIKARYGLPVIKAIGIAEAVDLAQIDAYSGVADQLLIDAKPPPGATRPGGNALAFDWGLIAERDWTLPWLLAGGLNPDNVALAVARTGARQLDVSSGVEAAPGIKDAGLIRAFIRNAQGA
ncbi:N-(5'-phosphoribosyl)anthranilate isomerase [Roseovarius sp. EC-HK134]|uniref:phosphoribosylanthranilate isomerase n=1 Tax=unclassified Roseovarius TaxID=2614913 RepID=UPI001258DE25|nr:MULTISPECIES: phosphoribosylanthranilate isomerase [unclassified Roseovarius]VVT26078.1 N-(5'-phosphoribosyl)anthranilate isomerase [Roseovarius sp. EC-HK134]VVT26253.1 N-(5'-phosphoribosyl)anthranilate isomerase [Roseovarius sp. EC-SD190]